MRLPRAFPFSALAAILYVTSAHAQCPSWIPGAFDNGATPNGTDGDVYAAIMWDPDGAGPLQPALVIGGNFTEVDGVAALHVAMRDPATGQWEPLGGGVTSPVNALTIWNGELIAGGDGDRDASTYDHDVLAWDGTSWGALGSGTNVGSVEALVVFNGDLYASGNFQITYAGADLVAKWNPNTGLWVAAGITTNPTNGRIDAMTVWNSGIVAGESYPAGSTYPAGGNLMFYDGTTWTFEAPTDGYINALQPFNGELAFAGTFTTVNGSVAAPSVAAWTGTSFHSYAPGGMNGPVNALTVYGGQLCAGGNFGAVGAGFLTPAAGMAVLSGGAWQSLAPSSVNDQVFTLLLNGSELIVGGRFTQAGAEPANRLARWNGTAWAPYGGGNVESVRAMTLYGGRLVLGGGFHQSLDPLIPAHMIASWNGTSLAPFGTGMDGTVYALKSYVVGAGISATNELVAGGYFVHAGGATVNNIARWDQKLLGFPPPAWQAMGGGFDGAVYAIERATIAGLTSTFAGGGFTSPGGEIARWDAGSSTWQPLLGGLNSTVTALRAYNGLLYAGGYFSAAYSPHVQTGSLAVWDGANWAAVGGVLFGGVVNCLEVFNGKLVIGGSFTSPTGMTNLVQWDGASYTDLGTGGVDSSVTSLHVMGTRLYVGGHFAHAGGVAASHLAYWDGSWHSAAGGTDNDVYALSDFGGEVEAGGVMLNAGSPPVAVPNWARGNIVGKAWFVSQPVAQSVNVGANVQMTAAPASGYGTSSEQWYRNDHPLTDGPTAGGSTISGSTTSALSIMNVAITDVGDYEAVAATSCGPDTSALGTLTVSGASTGVGDSNKRWVTRLGAIGPNPNHGDGVVEFTLAHSSGVVLRFFDIAGRQIGRSELGRLDPGPHHVAWTARSESGRKPASGIYFVGLEVDGAPIGRRTITIIQ